MQKLHLDLAELHVETFAVTPSPDDDRGTVLGRSDYSYENITCSQPTVYPCGFDSQWCSGGCEHGPGWTHGCPEEEP